jgi:transposase
LAWVAVAVYLQGRHPDCHLVKTQAQNVAALRKYLRRSSKSDKIDAITLAKMPFVDAERMAEVSLPTAKIYATQRLARQRRHLECDITSRKTRIMSILDGYLPGVRQTFSNLWSVQAKTFLKSRLNPLAVVRDGERALHLFLAEARSSPRESAVDSHALYLACQAAAMIYEPSLSVGMIDDDFFARLVLNKDAKGYEIEALPSDAIALTLVGSKPIYATESVIEQQGILLKDMDNCG